MHREEDLWLVCLSTQLGSKDPRLSANEIRDEQASKYIVETNYAFIALKMRDWYSFLAQMRLVAKTPSGRQGISYTWSYRSSGSPLSKRDFSQE